MTVSLDRFSRPFLSTVFSRSDAEIKQLFRIIDEDDSGAQENKKRDVLKRLTDSVSLTFVGSAFGFTFRAAAPPPKKFS